MVFFPVYNLYTWVVHFSNTVKIASSYYFSLPDVPVYSQDGPFLFFDS